MIPLWVPRNLCLDGQEFVGGEKIQRENPHLMLQIANGIV
jgi:hypothetical protein